MDRSSRAAIPILAVQSQTKLRHVFAIRMNEAYQGTAPTFDQYKEFMMKRCTALMLAGFAAVALTAAPLAAYAEDSPPKPKGGTLKGAAVGGVAGHMMGGHTKTGAAVGAAAGHHEKAKSEDRINAGQQP